MPLVEWPVSLPSWSMAEGFVEIPADAADYTQVDKGPVRARRVSTAREDTIMCSFIFTKNQYITFRNFYKTVTHGGSRTFSFIHPITKDELELRIASSPELTTLGGTVFKANCTFSVIRVLNYFDSADTDGVPGLPPPQPIVTVFPIGMSLNPRIGFLRVVASGFIYPQSVSAARTAGIPIPIITSDSTTTDTVDGGISSSTADTIIDGGTSPSVADNIIDG